MDTPISANYVFLPWVRQGAAADIQEPDRLGANQAGSIAVDVRLRINDTDEIVRQVRLYGPGDVAGIDPQQVVRTEPRHLATDFEPNYFPAIEFDRPDFPWVFTPAKADAAGKLRPWLCLIVVRKQEGVRLRTEHHLPLRVLEIEPPALPEAELPDLSESWAWAHVQIAGSRRDAASLKAALAGDPALTVSRLLCPRRLDPATEYLACVVPAFELGCKAGLDLPITPDDEKQLKPAWASGAQSPLQVTLPVYFYWEFRTGSGGDFEALVRLLEPREIPPGVGKRLMDISQPGFQINPPLLPGTALELEGALRVLDAQTAEWPQETRKRFQDELKGILNAPWKAMQKEGHEPLLAPPIYGCWQAALHTVETTPEPPASPPNPPWLHELNLDPRHRAVAALGTQVVQAQQEQLMASAWEQLGEIERINQMRRQAQLARAVNAVYHSKHFARFSEETLLKVVASAQSRLVVEATGPNAPRTRAMLSQRISKSAIPDRAVSAPLRRMTSGRSAIRTRFQPAGALPVAILTKLNTPISIVLFQKKEAGLVTLNQVADSLSGPVAAALKETIRFEKVSNALHAAPELGDFRISPEGTVRNLLDFKPGLPASADAHAFLNAAKAHQDYLEQSVFMTFWQNYQFVFSGGEGIIYAVDRSGRLLFHRDQTQDGIRDVTGPTVIGPGGWQNHRFVFSGGEGIIYAVDQAGRLLFYRDKKRDGTGDVANPAVIGLGGWQNFRLVFSGGEGIIYAIDQAGRLLFYRDKKRDGTGDVANPAVIGLGGWLQFKFLCSGGKGIIYAVDPAGQLLFYRDKTRDGTGDVAAPMVIGPGGWLQFKFFFSDDNGVIYVVDPAGRLLASRDKTRDGTGEVAFPAVIGPAGTSISAPPLDLSQTRGALLQSIDPAKTIAARMQMQVPLRLTRGAEPTGDPLEPLLDAPDFPQPMYEALRDLSQDFLFPGLEHVPANTVTLLKTNPQFVESFLVGLNAEMSSELLWRNYPTDQRGTSFRQFWDTLVGNDQADIDMIKKWGDRKLGDNARAGDKLVLLLRGELLRRYPNAVIYAVAGVQKDGRLDLSPEPEDERQPLFRGTLKPDVTFLGFDLTDKEAIGDPGWFFVIQQQPTEPCFGLDAADFGKPLAALATWNDLSWRHLAETEEKLKALSYASVAAVLPDIDQVKWGRSSAHQAYITLQRPVRIAIHAREMIKPRAKIKQG